MGLETKLTALGILIFLWVASVTGIGLKYYNKGIEHQRALDAKVIEKQWQKQDKVTTQIVTKYIPQIQKIQGDTITIVKKVPIYVTRKDDSLCPIPNGFVSLWNAANQMPVSNASSGVDAGTSKVVLSDIATEHATEAGITHADETQLEALQEWVREQERISH